MLQLPELHARYATDNISRKVENCLHLHQEYIIEREGEYPTSLWACVTTPYGVHELCNNIHMLEASVLAVCGHVAKPQVLYSTNAGCCSC